MIELFVNGNRYLVVVSPSQLTELIEKLNKNEISFFIKPYSIPGYHSAESVLKELIGPQIPTRGNIEKSSHNIG